MAKIGDFLNNTRSKIDNLSYGGSPRPYLGMSGIGHHCSRALFYSFHWCTVKKHSSRKERIFNAGHLFEPQIIAQLKEAGFKVYKIINGEEVEHFGSPEEKQEEYIGFASHAKGHSDGRIIGVVEDPEEPHLLEIKTMNDSKFNEVSKKGVKSANLVYYSQMQRYMRATGLKWALFISINKNNCSLYIERVKYNEKHAQDLVRKEQLIIMTDIVPHSDYEKTFYKCSYCDHRPMCHKEEKPNVSCRSCEYCDIEDKGQWSCRRKDGKTLSVEDQRKACKDYKLGWGLNE